MLASKMVNRLVSHCGGSILGMNGRGLPVEASRSNQKAAQALKFSWRQKRYPMVHFHSRRVTDPRSSQSRRQKDNSPKSR
jgi:hypothetical protein